jgi:uncharacterized membrane protein YdbT with pleckstrin-like domain
MNLKREDIKYLLKVAIFVALFVIAIRFVIYLLPVIIIALLVMLVYDSYKRNNGFLWKKKKNNGIKEAEIIKEKKNN